MAPRSLKRLSGYYRPYGKALGLAAFLMLMAALSQAGLVFLIEHVLDSGLIARDEQVLRSIPWLLCGLYAVKGLAISGRAYLIHRAGLGVVKTLRVEAFAALLRQDRRWHQSQASADWVSRLSADISHVDGLAHALTGMVEKPLTILALLGSALWLDWRLTLAVLCVLPVLALAVAGFAKKQGVATQDALDGRANLSKNAQESLDGVMVIQAFHGESARVRGFEKKALSQQQLRMREEKTTPKR